MKMKNSEQEIKNEKKAVAIIAFTITAMVTMILYYLMQEVWSLRVLLAN